jgi:integrase
VTWANRRIRHPLANHTAHLAGGIYKVDHIWPDLHICRSTSHLFEQMYTIGLPQTRTTSMIRMDFLTSLEPSFYRDCKYRELAELSIVNYKRAIKVYRNWLNDNKHPIDDTCLQPDTYAEFAGWVKENRAPSTANLYITLVRAFANWAYDEGEITEKVPFIKVKPGPRKPQVIEDDTLALLIKACKQHERKLAIRNELIVRLLLDTGIRRAELLGIKLNDIDFDDLSIQVTGKGNKTRLVYFGNNTGRSIDRYLRVRDKFPGAKSDWLLLGRNGKLGAGGLKLILYKLCDSVGIDHINPHAFRHTFSHDWLDNGGSERDLMRVAGWSSPAMLKIYGAEKANERASGAHKRLSRGDRV